MRKKKPHVAVMNAINGFLVVVCSDVSSAMAGQMRKQRSLSTKMSCRLTNLANLSPLIMAGVTNTEIDSEEKHV
jgi:hypothetical protein